MTPWHNDSRVAPISSRLRVTLDRAEPGQWAFGLISWPEDDAVTARTIIIAFAVWQCVVSIPHRKSP